MTIRMVDYVKYQGTLHLQMIRRGWREEGQCFILTDTVWIIKLVKMVSP